MKHARRGIDGPLLTLKQYIDAENGQTDPGKWKIEPVCPDCGEPVHVYDVSGALGFKLAGQQVTRRHARPMPGFHHYDLAAGENCPSSFRYDPRFTALARQKYDFRVLARNREILNSPEVRELNAGVLRRLWKETAGRAMEPEDKKRLHGLAMKRKLYHMEALGSHPWLLSYFLMILYGHHERYSRKNGVAYKVAFRAFGERHLAYRDMNGAERVAEVPMYIEAHYINETKSGRKTAGKAVYGARRFYLSEDEAYAAAGMKKPQRPATESARRLYQMNLFPPPPEFLQGPRM